jgi:hypothetical protein
LGKLVSETQNLETQGNRGIGGERLSNAVISVVPADSVMFLTFTRHLNISARRLAPPFCIPGYFQSRLSALKKLHTADERG